MKSPLNLNIETRVKYASLRLFGRHNQRSISRMVEKFLIRKCVNAGEVFPAEIMPKTRKTASK